MGRLAAIGAALIGLAATQAAAQDAAESAYDARLLASAAAAERFQGDLDGGWTLTADDTGPLYAFQFSDGDKGLEGAWRDLRRPGGLGASGFLDEVRRGDGALVLRFTPLPQTPAVVTLHGVGLTRSGELDQDGRRFAVTLRKASR